MIKPIAKFRTDGSGFWSKRVDNTGISIEGMRLYIRYCDTDVSCSLDVYYDPKDWKVAEDGLIYTDEMWLTDLKEFLVNNKFGEEVVEDIDYSEAGMQGLTSVNLDVPEAFATEADPFYRFVTKKPSIDWLKITKEIL